MMRGELPSLLLLLLLLLLQLFGLLSGVAALKTDDQASTSWCSCQWLDGQQLVGGLAKFKNDSRCSAFNRLPASAGECGGGPAVGRVSAGPWSMSRAPAGAFLQFTTDSTLLYLNATVLSYLSQGAGLTNLDTSVLGWTGMDMYVRTNGAACNNNITGPDGGCWRWVSTVSQWKFRTISNQTVGEMSMQNLAIPCRSDCQPNGQPPLNQNASYRFVNNTFRLHLPTHVQLQGVQIGAPDSAYLAVDRSWQKRPPIVWYELSQARGVAAARWWHLS
jgi:hypothetical protein